MNYQINGYVLKVSTFYLADPHNLGIRCRVNGQTMQNSTTKNLIFKTPQIISYISRYEMVMFMFLPLVND